MTESVSLYMSSFVASEVNWLFFVVYLPKSSKNLFYDALIATQIYQQTSRVLHVNVLNATKTSVLFVVIDRLPKLKLVAKNNIPLSSANLMTQKSVRLPAVPFKCIMVVLTVTFALMKSLKQMNTTLHASIHAITISVADA